MVDPIRTLPNEVTTALFSLLSTNHIALCSSVSKQWRVILQSDLLVNRILDLTKGKCFSEEQIIQLVLRMASLHFDPRKELLLDVTPFVTNLQVQLASYPGSRVGEAMRRAGYTFPFLIATIAAATKGKLARLYLEADLRINLPVIITLGIVEATLLLDKSIGDLREVRFSVSSSISLVSESPSQRDGTVRKSVSVESPVQAGVGWRSSEYRKLIQSVNSFTRGNLVSIGLPHEQTGGVQRLLDLRELFRSVLESKRTLKSLSLGIVVDADQGIGDPVFGPESFLATWNLVKSLSNLSKLELSLQTPGGMPNYVGIPHDQQEPQVLQLKELNLLLIGVVLPWDLFPLSWIGDQLQTLHFGFCGNEMVACPITAMPSEHLVSFLNSIPTLRQLHLRYVKIAGDSHQLVLPNLQELNLEFISLEGHGLFVNAALPVLKSLEFNLEEFLVEDVLRPLHEVSRFHEGFFFLPVLKSSQPTLERLQISGKLKSTIKLKSTQTRFLEKQFCFPQLESLLLLSTSDGVGGSLSHSQFPRLKRLDFQDTHLSPQALLNILDSSSSSIVEFATPQKSNEMFYYSRQIDQGLAFPRLKSLRIAPSAAFVLDVFINATFGELEGLHFSMGKDLQQVPSQTLSLEDLIGLLRANSRTIKRLEINGSQTGDEQSQIHDSEFYFPRLDQLLIKDCSELQIRYFFTRWSFSKISTLRIEAIDLVSLGIQSQLFDFMIKSSATLRILLITRLASEEETNPEMPSTTSGLSAWNSGLIRPENGKVDFRKLEELDLCGRFDFKFIAKVCLGFSFPKLRKLSFRQSDFETEDEQDLRNLVLETLLLHAPKLEQISMIGSDERVVATWGRQMNPESCEIEWERVEED